MTERFRSTHADRWLLTDGRWADAASSAGARTATKFATLWQYLDKLIPIMDAMLVAATLIGQSDG